MSNRDNIEITLITENDRERMEQVAQMETDVFPDPWSYHEVRSTHTVLKNYPLYCPKCRQETLIEVENLQVTVIKEPDAQTQSR